MKKWSLVLGIVTLLVVASATVGAGEVNKPSSQPANSSVILESLTRTNEMVKAFNVNQMADAKALKAFEAQPMTVDEVTAAMSKSTDAKVVTSLAQTLRLALIHEAQKKGEETVVSPPILYHPRTEENTPGVSNHDLRPCVFLVTGSDWGSSTEINFKAACHSPSVFNYDSTVTADILESTDSEQLMDYQGRNKRYNRSDYRLVEIDDEEYDGTHDYAYMGTIQTTVISPVVLGEATQTVVKPFNKVGKPYPELWDSNSSRMLRFPEAPYSPPQTPDYDQFTTDCRAHYRDNQWTWMTFFSSTHHVKPARWGGGDNPENCFRLRNWDHSKFTTWWGSGNQKFETPVSD